MIETEIIRRAASIEIELRNGDGASLRIAKELVCLRRFLQGNASIKNNQSVWELIHVQWLLW